MKPAIVLLGLLVATSSVQATTFNASAEFSAIYNPSGVWSYGTVGDRNAQVRTFQAYAEASNFSGLDYWYNTQGQVAYNSTNNPITSNTVTWPASTLSIVNTAASHASVVRFTAPIAGTYDISGSFFTLSSVGLSDVGIVTNYDTLFTSENRSAGLFGAAGLTGTASFSVKVFLERSDTVDFAVGGRYLDERGYTGLEAVAAAIPEPNGYLLMLLGLGIIGWEIKGKQGKAAPRSA